MIVLILGAGDLASGVALRLSRCGFQPVMTELAQPLMVRRLVSFGEAVYRGAFRVEGVPAQRAGDAAHALALVKQGIIPVLVDPHVEQCRALAALTEEERLPVLVDARMTKSPPTLSLDDAELLIGLGPGFCAGETCHAVVETQRGHMLGRVIWQGTAMEDTGVPESVQDYSRERVLRAMADGELRALAEIGDHVEPGQPVAEIGGQVVHAPFGGVLRGLIHSGLYVRQGMKIGDLDPRDDPLYCTLASDKSLAIGGGVLEAILSRPQLRARLGA